jgi:hypothetical protein
MFTGQTTIGKVFARCPARTEPLVARMRLGHLFQSVDIAPRGFPPHAVLVIRRMSAPRGISLGALRLRSEWEREMREEVALLWRCAVRPARGLAPEWAEAILFADEGEWLACLGLAVARREVERHWCWRASLGAESIVSSTQTLVRAWASAPRFLPAALVNLARWGEAARVLGTLQPWEAGTLFSALRAEFDLPRIEDVANAFAARTTIKNDVQREPTPRERSAAPRRANLDERDAVESATAGSLVAKDGAERSGTHDASDPGTKAESTTPPWKHWLPSAGSECERLPATAQRLLAFAAALFHAPSLARSRSFAEEVFAFAEGKAVRAQAASDATHATARREAKSPPRGADERHIPVERHDASDSAMTLAARGDDECSLGPEHEAPTPSHPSREQEGTRGVVESSTPQPAAQSSAIESHDEESSSDIPVLAEDAGEAGTHYAPWAELEGCETRLGGVLFLLNLFIGLRLPECFDDDDYKLSEHITGWGLAELLARALLGGACTEFDRDPLWGALAHLDGRAEGEPPAADLKVGLSYRTPARWLRLFAPRDEEWVVCEDEGRMLLWHSGGFPIAVRPLNGLTPLEAAAQLVDAYHAQGVPVARLEEARTWLEEAHAPHEEATAPHEETAAPHEETHTPHARTLLSSAGLCFPFEHFPIFDHLNVYGGAQLSPELRRWMGLTFPFLRYALGRSLEDEAGLVHEAEFDMEEAAREMLVRRGRLFCTATHVDLLMEMNGVSFPARRAGFDASPGWVRDLMRVVAFHYE